MTAQELFDHILDNNTLLFVRLFVDFVDPRVTIDAELLDVVTTRFGLMVRSFQNQYRFGDEPHFRKGTWSDPAFARRLLYPRLESHPQWLVHDQIVVVARLADGTEIVAPPLGRLVSQYLVHASASRGLDDIPRRRLRAIVDQSNRRKTDLELLV